MEGGEALGGRLGPWVGRPRREEKAGWLLRTHSLVRMLMGYMTGMLAVTELSSRRLKSSLLLQGAGQRAVLGDGLARTVRQSEAKGRWRRGWGSAHQLTLASSLIKSPQESFCSV